MNAQPHVLSPPLMESLQSFFPTSISQDNFWMKYSMVRDGSSLHSLMQNARGAKYSILAIETTDGEGTYSVFCQSTFPDNNIRRHTIFWQFTFSFHLPPWPLQCLDHSLLSPGERHGVTSAVTKAFSGRCDARGKQSAFQLLTKPRWKVR